MTAVSTTQTMTAAEYLALPPKTFGWASNLVDGEVVMGEPKPLHQRTAARLFFELEQWVRSGERRGSVYFPLDVGIDDRNVYAPDLSWWPEGRDPEGEGDPPFPVPGIAIEVRSPSTWRHDIGVKKSGYERRGLPELWLVDTAASEVLIFRRSEPSAPAFDGSVELGTGDVLESPLLPGFALPLERLFG
jgi:Uma2 family endonuclease